ncbi:hypothetical protein C2E23DRAFT_951630 [Lenzites betulinus]|nr:hypothetical protein C2E23DRAFT_951630 [Lenzites betulinus]
MQRRTSQTFQRLRKLSDSLVSAIAPNQSASKSDKDSFFDYGGKKGWHPPPKASTSSTSLYAQAQARAHGHDARRHPSYRGGQRVSKEDIRYPLIRTAADSLDTDPDVDPNASSPSLAQSHSNSHSHSQSHSHPRHAHKQREREREKEKERTRARRPERPREEDLPYGAPGSVPRAHAPPYVPPPPAVGSGPLQVVRPSASGSSVPFPRGVEREGVRERERGKEREGRLMMQGAGREKPLPEPPREAFYNLFRSAAVPVGAPVAGPSTHARPARADDALRTRTNRTREECRQPERARTRAPEPEPQPERTRQPYARVRRISSTGDVHPAPAPPSASSMYARPELRPVRSTPLRTRERSEVPVPVSPQPLVHVAKPRPRNVPRDVSPSPPPELEREMEREGANPQRLPTPPGSREDVRVRALPPQQQREYPRYPSSSELQRRERPPASLGPVAARAQAALRTQESAGPKAVRLDGVGAEHVVRPARDAERERREERERQRERERAARDTAKATLKAQESEKAKAREERARARQHRPTHTRAVEIEYYGMADAFSQEITIALAEPERAHPLPLDWRVAQGGAGPGYDYGVRPLVTKKSRQMQVAGAAAR